MRHVVEFWDGSTARVRPKVGFSHRGQEMSETSIPAGKRGRPRSIPVDAYGLLFKLYGKGLGYRAIADRLSKMGVCNATKSSVERLIRSQGVYRGAESQPSG